jgi:hypothetical protein
MTVKEAAARAREKDEKDEMVALLDQLLDFLDEHLASPHLSVDTKTGVLMLAGALREDILTAAGEPVR